MPQGEHTAKPFSLAHQLLGEMPEPRGDAVADDYLLSLILAFVPCPSRAGHDPLHCLSPSCRFFPNAAHHVFDGMCQPSCCHPPPARRFARETLKLENTAERHPHRPAPWGTSTTCILPLLIPSHGEHHNSFSLTLLVFDQMSERAFEPSSTSASSLFDVSALPTIVP
jgi:hypothetical protein